MAGISAWRANDVVEYDAMRDDATKLVALLLRESSSGLSVDPSGADEIRELRRDVLTVDGGRRAAVSALAARIRNRIAELTGPRP